MWNERKFPIKDEAKKLGRRDNWDFSIAQVEVWVRMRNSFIAEMNCNSFGGRKLKAILICPDLKFIEAVLKVPKSQSKACMQTCKISKSHLHIVNIGAQMSCIE